MARVFISHATDDSPVARQVLDWFIQSGHDVFLSSDMHAGIPVGAEWEKTLHERLRWADVVVCIVTTAYLRSVWCAAEAGIARSRGNRIVPVLAESGVSHPLLSSLQHADLIASSAVARAQLDEALRRSDVVDGSGWTDNSNPYPGLRALDVDDGRIFFGRTTEIQQLTALLRSPDVDSEISALLVVGPSGCGKSSLVRAGLAAVLAHEPEWSVLPPIRPGGKPVEQLARALAHAARRLGATWTAAQVNRQLRATGLSATVDELLLLVTGHPPRRALLIVDQLEELLTQAADAERVDFLELVGPALRTNVFAVATLRPEYLQQVLVDTRLAAFAQRRAFIVRPLDRGALRSVVEGPARVAGIEVPEGLVAQLLEDTATGEALPLLAFTLSQLADGVPRGGRLPVQRYQALGGVRGALRQQADLALEGAIEAGGRSEDEVIRGLLRLATVDEHDEPTRWSVPLSTLSEAEQAEYRRFVARRLLATDAHGDEVLVSVSHEALLTAWPPLATAVRSRISVLRMRSAIERASTEWARHGKHRDSLLRGPRLAALGVYPVTDESLPALSPDARQFLSESAAEQDWEIRQERLRGRRLQQLVLAGSLIALSCLLTLLVARSVFTDQLDDNLLQRATAAANTDLIDPDQLVVIPVEVFGAGDIRLALLRRDGTASSAEGADSAPPLGVEELAVARGEREFSIRTSTDSGREYRVVAVPAGDDQALVLAQDLEPTQTALRILGSVLAIPAALAGALSAVGAILYRRRSLGAPLHGAGSH